MNIEELGYFLFMEEQEKKAAREREEREAAAVGEYKVNSNYDLVGARATYNENLRRK